MRMTETLTLQFICNMGRTGLNEFFPLKIKKVKNKGKINCQDLILVSKSTDIKIK